MESALCSPLHDANFVSRFGFTLFLALGMQLPYYNFWWKNAAGR